MIILDHSELKKAIEARRQAAGRLEGHLRHSFKFVFTNGVFDLLHVGHIRYLQEARDLGDCLVVAINADASVKRLKGDERPLQHELDRIEIMNALRCVDFVTLFGQVDDTPLKLIEFLSPDILVKGGDWAIEKIAGSKFVLEHGGEVRSLQFQPGRSTTAIIEKMASKK